VPRNQEVQSVNASARFVVPYKSLLILWFCLSISGTDFRAVRAVSSPVA